MCVCVGVGVGVSVHVCLSVSATAVLETMHFDVSGLGPYLLKVINAPGL